MDKCKNRKREIQVRLNNLLKNIKEINHLIDVRSDIKEISNNLKGISLPDNGFKKIEQSFYHPAYQEPEGTKGWRIQQNYGFAKSAYKIQI